MAQLDLNSICRLCVQFFDKEKIYPIFNNETYCDKISLPERIRYCSSIEVAEDDGLPPQICDMCLSKLNQSFIFRNQCVLADLTLKRLKVIGFNVNEIPNLLKVDIENQIIQSGKDIFHSTDADKKKKQKNGDSIDEFDNSKNGRHKRIIHKLKSIPLQKTKVLIQNINTTDCQNYDNISEEAKKNLEPCVILNLKKIKKNNTIKEMTKNVNLEDINNSRKIKMKKQCFTGDEKLEDTLRGENEIENFPVNRTLLNFKKNTENFSLNLNPEGVTRGSTKDVPKLQPLKTKKGKRMKITYNKEKPSFYKCDHCQKVYPTEGGWRYHIYTMHNENYQPFICDLCGQAFKVKKNLEAHKNSIHFHLKQNLCDLCGRGFASKYALKVHKIWHNDEKNFSCDVCGTKFRTRGKMNTHRSIHGGRKKFMCHICSRDFRWKKDFEIHMRTHTGEKPYKCAHCGKAFASLTNMKKHEKNHLKKLEIDKKKIDSGVLSSQGKLRRNDFFVFCYGLDDVKNGQINQYLGSAV